MKVQGLILLFVMTIQVTSFAQLGEGIFNGQISANSLATGGALIDFSMPDSAVIELHAQRPYSLHELDKVGIEASLPFKPMHIQATFIQTGDNIMMEQSFQVCLKKKVSMTMQVNVGCGLYLFRTINECTGTSFFADLGIMYSINGALKAGCRLINPTGSTIKLQGEKQRMEQICIIGLNYHPAAVIDLDLEGEKRPQQVPITRFGLIYRLNQAFRMMGGLSLSPLQPAWGIGGKTGRFRYTLGVRLHPQLGLTSALTCSYLLPWKP